VDDAGTDLVANRSPVNILDRKLYISSRSKLLLQFDIVKEFFLCALIRFKRTF
jgi:hypothetical protein